MSKKLILASAAVASLLLARHDPVHFPSLTWTFLGISTLLLTGLFAYDAVIFPLMLSPLRHIPTPKGANWLLGHFLDIHRNTSGVPQLKWMEELHNNNGLIRYRGLFNGERIVPTSAKTLSEALHQKSYSFIKPDFMRNSIGRILGLQGILFSEGDEHRHQRKVLLPAFSHSQIKNLVPTFWDVSLDLTEKISEIVSASVETPVIDMSHWFSLATLDIIGLAGFGYKFNALASVKNGDATSESGSELSQAYNTIFKTSSVALAMHIARLVFPNWFLKLLPIKRTQEIKEASEVVKRVSLEIIDAKKLEIAEKKAVTDRDILSVMLKSGQYDGPDGVEIMRDQMMTFLAAGHETTATSMTWALYVLSLKENIHIQNRLREEIRDAYPHGIPEKVSYEQIESLKYLRNVTSEVLRIYPPVRLTARHAAEDTTLGDQFIPKGAHIVLVPYAINRSKELWGEDADQFRPDRWNEGQGESNYAFLTFLAGPRGCIGNVFAKLEFKCLLAAMIGKFAFVEAEEGREIVVKGGITAKPSGGIPLKVSIVEGW
ncbi:uncharacterized protein H6S33_000266 [Morchella sextelata]|uniref:uncharacterized protein n=1 Tax=Morchella sextelata TaxID=1174677 RepID=UPI001D046591|nr:uncharacterized protein H6S33_000266 [Morchella sextelata]KAH0614630.1 hypothetical protein H6S33_000266 [Morchella sextelata]